MSQQPNLPFANDLLNRLTLLQAENNRKRQEPQHQMRDEIKQMYDLIRGPGVSGFRMMGARHIIFDNATYMLQWQMGSGAKVDTVQFYYDDANDLYKLRFIAYGGQFKGKIKSDETLEGVFVEDVRGLIEDRTGFYLSF